MLDPKLELWAQPCSIQHFHRMSLQRKRPRENDWRASCLAEESTLLSEVLTGKHRRRVFRHHRWHADGSIVLRHLRCELNDESHPKLLEALVCAGVSARQEMRLERINTVGLCTALLCIYARVHKIVRKGRYEEVDDLGKVVGDVSVVPAGNALRELFNRSAAVDA